jgi:serine/threonine protein phosphatase PrpC
MKPERGENEDAFGYSLLEKNFPLGLPMIVADGAGGRGNGDWASGEAVRKILELLNSNPDIEKVVSETHWFLRGQIEEKIKEGEFKVSPAASLAAVLIKVDGRIEGAYVGNVLVVVLRRSGKAELLTDCPDLGILGSGSADLKTIRGKELSEGGNVLTQAVGADMGITVHRFSSQLKPGDRLVVFSDGAWDYGNFPEIEAVIRKLAPEQAVGELMKKPALDDRTVLIVECQA